MIRLFLRRSYGRWAAPFLVAVIVIDVSTRSTGWRFEWLRALLQYHFVTLFIGPLVAGLGTWEAHNWARARLPAPGRGRPLGTLAAAWLGTLTWLVGVYLAGLIVVGVVVHASGVPGLPDLATASTTVPALLLLAGWLAIGYVLGTTLHGGAVLAPFVTIVAFAFTIAAWTGLPGHLVEVGGATASLVGLAIRPSILAAQSATWAGIIAACAAGLAVRTAPGRRSIAVLVLCLVGVAASYGWQVSIPGDRLQAHAGGVHCGGTPVVCLAPGYEHHRAQVEHSLAAVSRRAAAAHLPTPRFSQDLAVVGIGTANITPGMLRGDPTSGAEGWVNGYFRSDCPHTSKQLEAFGDLWDLLVGPLQPGAVPRLRGAPLSAVRHAYDVSRGCSTTTAPS